MKRIGLVDTTFRDAQQCLWATRMTTPMMLPVAERLDRAGFDYVLNRPRYEPESDLDPSTREP